MSGEPTAAMNPWRSVWTRPRHTVRWVVGTDPRRSVLLLAGLGGIAQALDRASARNLGDRTPLPAIIAAAVVVGPIWGVITLYVGGFLVWWTGRWFGGRGTPAEVRAAVAWSWVPAVAGLLLMVPQLAIFGRELFTSETPVTDADPLANAAMIGFGAIDFGLAVWSVVLLLKCLGEVQGFSAWKAIGNVALAGGLVMAPVIVVALLILSAR